MIRPAGRFLLKAFIIFMVILTAFSAAFLWRLAHGPVSLAFLSPVAKRTLTFGEAGYHAEIDDTVLTWGGWAGSLDIRVRGLHVFDATGAEVGSVPEIALELSARALLKGMLAPTALELSGPSAVLVRDRDGRVTLGDVAATATKWRAGIIIAAVLREFAKPPNEDKAIGYLRTLNISSIDIVMADEKTGKSWRLPGAVLAIERQDGGITGSASGAIEVAGRAVRILARGNFDTASGRSKIAIDFADLDPGVMAGEDGILGEIAGLSMDLGGTVTLEFSDAGKLADIGFDIAADAGRLDLPRFYFEPVALDGISTRGSFDPGTHILLIEDLDIRAGPASLRGQGLVDLSQPRHPDITFSADLGDLTVQQILRFWPNTKAPKARAWIEENILTGRVPDANLQVRITPEAKDLAHLPPEAIDLRFGLEDVTVRYMRQFPVATGARGRARLNTHELDVTIDSAEGSGMAVSQGHVVLHDIHLKGRQTGEVDLLAEGPLAKALALLDHPPFTFIKQAGIDPRDAHGDSVTRAHVKFPLRKGIKQADIVYTTQSTLTGAAIDGLLKNLEIANGELDVAIKDNLLHATGKVTLNGVPADVVWNENLLHRETSPSRYAIRATLRPEQLTALGLPGEGFIEGPVDGEVHFLGRGAQIEDGEAKFDLSDAQITIDEIGWAKPPGLEAGAKIKLHTDNSRLVIDDFALTGGGLDAEGNIDLADDYSLDSININSLILGETDLSLKLRRNQPNDYRLEITGPAFNAVPLIRKLLGRGGNERPLPAFDVSLDIERVIAERGVEMHGLSGSARYSADKWDRALVGAAFDPDSKIEISFERTAGRRHLSIESDDAGQVAKGLDLYANGVGGTMTLTAMIDDSLPDAPVTGELMVVDFRVVDAPALAKILTLVSLTGIGDMLQGDGISFKEMEIPFRLAGGSLSIDKGRAHGAAIGFTMRGLVHDADGMTDIDGTIIPAYTINALLAKLPIVGTILAGPNGEGIFAFTFRVSGPREDPKVSVNPLAVLAPGILRELFSDKRPVPKQEPKPPPKQTKPVETPRQKEPKGPPPGP